MPGEEQSRDESRLETRLEIAGIEEIVLDGVARARDMRILEAANGAHHLVLNVEGQAGRDPVGIHLAGLETFRLDEDLMRFALGETDDLVFHGRTVAWPDAFDDTAVERRSIERRADNRVAARVRVGDMARHLTGMLSGIA